MIRPFNPLTYARYLLSSNEERTKAIFALLREDEFCAKLLSDLERYGHHISYPLWGGGGTYQSCELEVGGEDFEEEFLKRHARGDFRAEFSLPPRFGLGQNAFYFLHELIHFDQDMRGQLHNADQNSVLRNECEAAVKSIQMAHALGGIVWEGALSSLDWGRLARQYSKDQDAEKLSQRWHQSAQKNYYTQRDIPAARNTHSPVHLWRILQEKLAQNIDLAS